jgi:hypothetical protein
VVAGIGALIAGLLARIAFERVGHIPVDATPRPA